MKAPVVPANDLEDVPKIIRGYKAIDSYGVTPELHKGLLQAYYASVSYMDAQAGKVIRALEKLGRKKDTIIVFSSDHGYLLGEHHKFQKQHLFEESTRVPFILSVPWMKDTHGGRTKKITELVDLYPTLAELAGLTPPSVLQGKSLVALIDDPVSKAWKKKMAFTISRNGGESIRTDDWRYIHWGHGEKGQELYDLKNDPAEFKNLAGNPKYADHLIGLKTQLLAKRKVAGYRK
jgi:arylsulfatase A-like enzyme